QRPPCEPSGSTGMAEGAWAEPSEPSGSTGMAEGTHLGGAWAPAAGAPHRVVQRRRPQSARCSSGRGSARHATPDRRSTVDGQGAQDAAAWGDTADRRRMLMRRLQQRFLQRRGLAAESADADASPDPQKSGEQVPDAEPARAAAQPSAPPRAVRPTTAPSSWRVLGPGSEGAAVQQAGIRNGLSLAGPAAEAAAAAGARGEPRPPPTRAALPADGREGHAAAAALGPQRASEGLAPPRATPEAHRAVGALAGH
ncbi:unnamed protein product, partial [Prorocentrum cordatum]